MKNGEKITFEDKGNNTISVISQDSTTEIKTLSPNDFPIVPEISKNAEKMEIDIEMFKKGILSTIFSVSNNNVRPTLSGVYIYTDGDDIVFVSTDIYRLSEYRIKKPKKLGELAQIIPSRTLQEFVRIFTGKENVLCFIDKNQIVFQRDETVLISRLIEGKFPDYKKIIPEKSEVKSIVSKDEFTRAIKKVSLFAKEQNYNVKIKIDSKKQEVVIFSEGGELGKQVTQIPCNIKGEDVEVALNSQYILDFLQIVDKDNIEIQATSKLVAVVFKKEKDDDFTHLIMPLKID